MGQDAERDDHETPPLSRDAIRSRRKRPIRASTISVKRMSKRELEIGRALYPPDAEDPARATTRSHCDNIPRPCPFVACRHHLYLDVYEQTGAIKVNFPDLEPDELEESCSLDVAGRFGSSLEEVAKAMNLTRERVRQIETKALGKIADAIERLALGDLVSPCSRGLGARRGPLGQLRGSVAKRRLPVLEECDDDDDDVPAPAESGMFDVDRFAGDDLGED
jgi:hypothetical protein